MLANLSGWHLVIILAVVLLLFGATRLPALSKSIAQSVRIFRHETASLDDDKVSGPSDDRASDAALADVGVSQTKA